MSVQSKTGERMHMVSRSISATLATGLVLLVVAAQLSAQQSSLPSAIAEQTPDAPLPQFMVASAEPSAQHPLTDKGQHEDTKAPLKESEQQPGHGFFFSSEVVYGSKTAALTKGQKMGLALRSAVDPLTLAKSAAVAGYHQVLDDDKAFGGGAGGYGKEFGAAYLGSFDSKIIGMGILPSLLHQDPRYFRLGHGAMPHRFFYALATAVVCKHDNTGKWEPNYSNVLGDLASSGISNLYYPRITPGVGETIADGLTSTAVGSLSSVFKEFWPDVSRKFLHRDPTHGLDAQVRAAEQPR